MDPFLRAAKIGGCSDAYASVHNFYHRGPDRLTILPTWLHYYSSALVLNGLALVLEDKRKVIGRQNQRRRRVGVHVRQGGASDVLLMLRWVSVAIQSNA